MSLDPMSRLRTLQHQLAYVRPTVRLIWRAAGRYTAAWGILLVVQGLIPAAQLHLIRLVVDSVVDAMGGGGNLYPVLLWGGLMGATLLAELALGSALGWLRSAQAELTRDHVADLVHEKSTLVDLGFYEIPEYHDLMEQVRHDLRERPLTMLESFGELVRSVVSLVAMGAILLGYGLWLPLLLVLSTVPVLLVVVHHNRRYHTWWEESTVDRRWSQYYDSMLTLDAAAAEVRLFELSPLFRGRWRGLRKRLREQHLSLTGRQDLARIAAGAFMLLAMAAAMAWMVWRALQGDRTLGDIALLYQALNRGQSLAATLQTSLGRVYSSTIFLGNLFEFLDLEPAVTSPERPRPVPARIEKGVTFRKVRFHYPGTGRPVFDGFDFHVPAGKIIAIVGKNGAGKSTMMKLLCRFYDPQEGAVEIDGIDVREFAVNDFRRTITALFQFPVPFLATVRENIAMGDLSVPHDMAEIRAAARGAGADGFITRLPEAYETLLGKWFPGGHQLSGGEWQRLALARSFLRDAEIMILDEPTSYLDSWAEIDWFERFRTLARGRTAILITHRFSTARYADSIHVMDEGEIVESGTHEELVAKGGLYARSWLNQTSGRRGAKTGSESTST